MEAEERLISEGGWSQFSNEIVLLLFSIDK